MSGYISLEELHVKLEELRPAMRDVLYEVDKYGDVWVYHVTRRDDEGYAEDQDTVGHLCGETLALQAIKDKIGYKPTRL